MLRSFCLLFVSVHLLSVGFVHFVRFIYDKLVAAAETELTVILAFRFSRLLMTSTF